MILRNRNNLVRRLRQHKVTQPPRLPLSLLLLPLPPPLQLLVRVYQEARPVEFVGSCITHDGLREREARAAPQDQGTPGLTPLEDTVLVLQLMIHSVSRTSKERYSFVYLAYSRLM